MITSNDTHQYTIYFKSLDKTVTAKISFHNDQRAIEHVQTSKEKYSNYQEFISMKNLETGEELIKTSKGDLSDFIF